ncbi:hypothetical protein Taro_050151 [Colocasia esculenta]|uniref:Protein-tyrosine-phosphatase IBR5 n=1 Tax=Colocasia esculenta TaxID=4460 RepID=A0A843XD23_COLES|nr:hypothetical protein [Colocasia esculenta]
MRKRERENPCGVCGHYHRYEEGEVCGVCGHRAAPAAPTAEGAPAQQGGSAFPSEILGGFLYLGSYDNASRGELLKTQGISRILNTVPSCQNLYKNSFTYHCLQDDKTLQFDDAFQFLEQCEKDRARVLVHCMSGRSRSPAVVIAYLMKSKGWRLVQGHHWVKERRPSVDLSPAVYQQLLDYEQRIFGSNEANQVQNSAADSLPSFGFGFLRATTDASPLPTFNQPTSSSIFDRTYPNINSNEFVFGAGMRSEQRVVGTNNNTASGTEAPMDSG